MKNRVIIVILLIALLFSATADAYVTAFVYVREDGGTLNLRKEPTTASESLGIVRHGDSVEIRQQGDEWSYIYVNRLARAGYLKTKYLKNVEYHSEEQGEYPSREVSVSYGSAAPYEAPCVFSLDLDGDGTRESVTFETVKTGEYDEETRLLVSSSGGKADTFVCDIHSFAQIFFVKLDGTGRAYMLVSGDEMSSDFVTYCLYWDGSAIKPVNFLVPSPYTPGTSAPGGVTYVQNGIVRVCDHRDVFGTWFASLDYSMNGGEMQCAVNPVWVVENDLTDPEIWQYRAMTAKIDLPAVCFDTFDLIPAGTRLLLTAIDDLNARAYYITDSGRTGYIEYGFDESQWRKTIGGVPEDDCFDNLFYAG